MFVPLIFLLFSYASQSPVSLLSEYTLNIRKRVAGESLSCSVIHDLSLEKHTINFKLHELELLSFNFLY